MTWGGGKKERGKLMKVITGPRMAGTRSVDCVYSVLQIKIEGQNVHLYSQMNKVKRDINRKRCREKEREAKRRTMKDREKNKDKG